MADPVDAAPKKERWPTRLRRRIRLSLPKALIAYAVILALVFVGLTDRLILFPSTGPIRVDGIERLEIRQSDGRPLEIWRARPIGSTGEPQAFVLLFIGNAARAEWMAADATGEWSGRPVEIWGVNYPGYGGSGGSARLKSIGPAALAAYDALAKQAAGRPIILQGHSLGTAAALHVAANRPVAGLVLTNPPPLRQLILQRHGWWNLWLLATPVSLSVPHDLDSIANARRVQVPAVFTLAERDSVVPPAYQQKVVDAYAGEKRLIHQAGADHNDPLEGPAAEEFERSLDWLWGRIQPARRP